jgi:hypothetical protein
MGDRNQGEECMKMGYYSLRINIPGEIQEPGKVQGISKENLLIIICCTIMSTCRN